MNDNLHIRFGGYSPPETTHSQASLFFQKAIIKEFKDFRVDLFWNILDFGYRAEDLLSMVESGLLTMCYFSTSYLTKRVKKLGIIDLPFIFKDLNHAHKNLDGKLGEVLAKEIENQTNFFVLGFWDNGFRHLSNRLHPVHEPSDCKNLKVRLQPNDIHVQTFKALKTKPVPIDLKPGIKKIQLGEVDAQENPLENTITYGIDKHHKFITLTSHFYGARGIFCNKDFFEALDRNKKTLVKLCVRKAIKKQRKLSEQKEREVEKILKQRGIEIVKLNSTNRSKFKKKVSIVIDKAKETLGPEIFKLIED
ncbi:MAG: TRAP transporter substrate-binding protein [Nitrospinota bacterium]|nr:TRAP transporter substrate-binding protein [Nitrospinota bacterium]